MRKFNYTELPSDTKTAFGYIDRRKMMCVGNATHLETVEHQYIKYFERDG